ncbi:MAG TPA: hypothetical protein VHJ78_12855 [Actinomycetota bacterium]|nr:hypothetical protein [Actinomycetota bacterium]
MPNSERNEASRPRQRFTTLLPSEHLRRTAVQAGREMDREQSDTVVSIAKVLDEIDDVESRTDLQTRLTVLEEQVESLNARRDDVDQSVESELSVLRTTMESTMEAIAALPAPGLAPEILDMLRIEFDEKLLATRTDFGYALQSLQNELETRTDAQADIEALRDDFQVRMDAADERLAKAVSYLEDLIRMQRDRFEEQKARQADVLSRLSSELSGLAGALAQPRNALTDTADLP